jgi:hypothetical protein
MAADPSAGGGTTRLTRLQHALVTSLRQPPGGRGDELTRARARRRAGCRGGEAGVDNRPGHGATFWVRIPG